MDFFCSFSWGVKPKPQKIADSNFLGFKGFATIKIRILWGPQYMQQKFKNNMFIFVFKNS
jgi:hypothetical protein